MVASVVKGLPRLNCWNLNAECTTWHDDVKSVNLRQCFDEVCVSSTVTVQVKHSETPKLQVTGLAPQHHHPRAQPPRSKCHSPGQTMDAKVGEYQAIRMCLLQLLTYPTLQRPGLPRTSKLNYLHHTSWPTWRESANPIARPGRPLRIRYLSAIQSCASTIPAAPACVSIAYQSQGRLRGVSCLRNPYPACCSTIACRERTQPTITWNPSFSSKCLKYHYWQLAQTKTSVQTIDLLESKNVIPPIFEKNLILVDGIYNSQNHFEVMLETNQPYLHCQASKWANWAKLLLGWRPSPCRGVETLGIMKQKTLDVSCFRERTPFCGIKVLVSKQWISPKNQGIPRW